MKMKKNTIEIIITSILIIVFIFAISNIFKRTKRRVAKREVVREEVSAIQKQSGVGVVPTKMSFKDLENRAKKQKWTRDPFVYSSTYLVGTTEDLKLEGIAWDRHSPQVMINGIILGVGERIGDYTVIDITQNSVILTDGIHEIILRL